VRSPSYLVVSLVVLATSIAAQVTMTAVIDGMLLRPPSGAEPSRIKIIKGSDGGGVASYFDYTNEAERNHAFSSLFAFHTIRSSLATADDVTQVSACVVSGTYFPTLGVQAASGRLIVPSDDIKGAAPVAVISSELSRRCGLDVGSTVRLNTTVFQVVGVLPPDYEGIEKYVRTEVWLPMWQVGAVDGEWMLTHHDYEWVTIGGRLRPGVSEGEANAETLTVSRQIAKEFPALNNGGEMQVQSVFKFRTEQDASVGAVLVLFFLGWFLFALAFANFFALTLVRLVNRRRELAVRLSLGASRSDMGRWLIGELLIVSVGSVASGFGLSHLFLWLLRRNPHFSELLERTQVRIDVPTFAVIILAVAMGILAVWFVALRVIQRTDLVTAYRETSTAPKRQRAMVALFAVQFGIVLFILAVAESLVGTLRETTRQKYPIRAENLLLTAVNLRSIGHAESQADSLHFMRTLMDRIRAVPGVTSVSASTIVPLGWMGSTNLMFEGKNSANEADQNAISNAYVSPQFLTTIELPILLGRDTDAQDFRNNADVVVIDRVAAHRFFPN
jgi:predicted permease